MKNFFVVGGQRCGTTWLYNILDQHPDILMAKPTRPEPKYFIEAKKPSINDYINKFFPNTNGNMLLGEKSTSYYELENIPKKIYEVFPKAKILFLLRNPIERALSNYYFSYNNGLENRTLEEVFLLNTPAPKKNGAVSVNPYNYIARGYYSKYIERYINYFGMDQVGVFSFEKLRDDKNQLSQLLSFLEVESTFKPTNYNKEVNSSPRGKVTPEAINRLLENTYEEEIRKLSKYIDTSAWALGEG